MLTEIDILTLARTVYGEARGESFQGKIAVAHVVLNRVAKESWYGKTIHGVCKKRWQFSSWNQNDPNRAKILAVTLSDKVFRACFLATLSATEKGGDPTEGSTHYHHVDILPRWAKGQVPVVSIGAHLFYNSVR
jgi:spore germination cell wall hydrolase CwlJ-like protein